jgi:hypothetical protein
MLKKTKSSPGGKGTIKVGKTMTKGGPVKNYSWRLAYRKRHGIS